MKLHELRPNIKKNKKRVGRGTASGSGKTSGRGTKGQKSRSGGNIRPGFEGGQMPLILRLPHKRGFKNIFAKKPLAVKTVWLNVFNSGDNVTEESIAKKIIGFDPKWGIKIINSGKLEKKLTVEVKAFSKGAKKAIEGNGGKAVEALKYKKENSKKASERKESDK